MAARTCGSRAVSACPWYSAWAQTSPVWLMRIRPATCRLSSSLRDESGWTIAGEGRDGWPLKGSRVRMAESACSNKRSIGE
ncbi:hypothetical protein D9M73_214750 [compost metagenome]